METLTLKQIVKHGRKILSDPEAEFPINLDDPRTWLTARIGKQLFPDKSIFSYWHTMVDKITDIAEKELLVITEEYYILVEEWTELHNKEALNEYRELQDLSVTQDKIDLARNKVFTLTKPQFESLLNYIEQNSWNI